MEWQPIETAPRDGNEILAYVHGDRFVAIEPIKWGNLFFAKGVGWINYNGDDLNHLGWTPTHWMPLPPPPKGED